MRSLVFILFCFSLNAAPKYTCPEESLRKLMEGNKNYTLDQLEHPNRNQERRDAVLETQEPFAAIVGCADSRVSPEVIFDQGVGDIFVVRVAGNVIGPLEIESVDYAVHHLKACLVIVLGHENCGAVNAVLTHNTKDIEHLAELIQPSVDQAIKAGDKNPLVAATKINALRMKEQLINSESLKQLYNDKKIDIQAAYYNLQTGVVDILK